jgi:hypothetical protein
MHISNEEDFTTLMAFLLVVAALIVDGTYALAIPGHLALP